MEQKSTNGEGIRTQLVRSGKGSPQTGKAPEVSEFHALLNTLLRDAPYLESK